MIKDVMVHLDGTAADAARLAAVEAIANAFDSRVIGLFLNILPMVLPQDDNPASVLRSIELVQQAREFGDRMEAELPKRLAQLQKPVELRRFDVFSDTMANIAAREARSADTFVALRPDGAPRAPGHVVEGVLFGSGRHLFLVPDREPVKPSFDHVLVAWNGSRESARAMAEAIPYLHQARTVTVVVVHEIEPELESRLGTDAVNHLEHHGIKAVLHHAEIGNGDVGTTLIAEAKQRKAGLIVMGGYGHSRLREWLLGGATYKLLHEAPVPLLVAH